jgi:predicted transcriptional regulator
MSNNLKELLERAATWPEEAQEELARMAYEIEEELKGNYHATPEELAGIDRGLRDAAAGRFATDVDVEAAFKNFRRA